MQPFKYKPNLNSGLFRHRISILRPPDPEKDVDEAGQPLDEWIPVAETWADIFQLRGRELFSAQQVNAEVTTRITIRYRTGIDRTMKAVYEGKVFEFLYVIDKDYAKKELQIMCKERQ
ncbi:phage head closure protein [Neobacillus massiliamazoniensis]|uniref:Phage head-tail adaptor n=1 Tax=Neobacillus massiliamazoniensis TaxID=1499688 RepID=A0A0U1NRD1_9BACI|nr:phage head closure protein [Neobacillus massiliamazoniensis]CRK80308.1 phage head-tail adaptor [Neobacillus massiliamazoniensis]